jgi:putative restriction endonuclease
MPAIFQIRVSEERKSKIHEVFHFENKYLSIINHILNDWIIYYRPAKRSGERDGKTAGYFATARVISVQPVFGSAGHSKVELAEFCEFPNVPFSITSLSTNTKFYYEHNMQESDGSLNRHANQQRIRLLSIEEYNGIMESAFFGYKDLQESEPPIPAYSGFAEAPPAPMLRSRFVTSRVLRNRAFSKTVGEAYGWKCAMTGIFLRASDGSHEVECAHIKPVKDAGPDSVRNGLPLLRTFHWLFDKGFISIDSHYRIIKSSQYNRTKIDDLINGTGRINLPGNELEHPHPDFLRYHREHVFQR